MLAPFSLGARWLRPSIVGMTVFALALATMQLASGQTPTGQSAPAAQPLWAHLTSDIAPDPAVTYGVLPNGMRYALMRNQLPPGAVSIRFDLHFGSLYEARSEQGLAHFIEHMAFNGSTHVAEGEMVKILERLGLAFGADTNAATTQQHTTYQFDLPRADEPGVEQTLHLVREIASELTFGSAEIEREKGIVLAEARLADTVATRRNQRQLDFLLPGNLAAARMPIGDIKVVEGATHDQLASLYERYYRPGRATLVIVGDIDVAALEARINAIFSDWAGRGAAGVEPTPTLTVLARKPDAAVFTDKDASDVISVYALSPYEDLSDTTANRREKTALGLALAVVNRRLALQAQGETPPFRSAGLVQSNLLEAVEAARASATVRAGEWRQGLEAVEQEWRRALVHGFTVAEVAEQVSVLRAGQIDAARGAAARSTVQLATQLMSSIQDDAVFSTPATALARIESWAPAITPDQVQGAFRRHMAVGHPLFFLSTSLPQPDAGAAIPLVWAQSARRPVAAPVPKIVQPFAYADFGPPGRVVGDMRRTDIDARLVTFANNVRLNLKRTAFEPGAVRVSLRIAGGAVGLENAPFGLASLMEAFTAGGLEAHSADDLRSILSGRKVQAGFSASTTAFGAFYATTPADLELQLDIAAAYVTHPGYRPDAERRWREGLALSLQRLEADAPSAFASRGARLLANGDKRFGRDLTDGLANRSFVELKAYLDPWLTYGAIEIAIVGDIDEATAISAVAKTFGALPDRDEVFSTEKSARPVKFRDPHEMIMLSHSGEADQALVNVYWHVDIDPDADPQEVRVLNALASVMRIKITETVRENLGASYSPSASFTASDAYPGLAYFVAGAEVNPGDVSRVSAALHAIAADLREGKISDDEFNRAVTPMIDQLPLHATSNAYWLVLLSQAQSEPARLERSRLANLEASARAVTKAELAMAAGRWLTDERAQDVRVMPRADPRRVE